ASKKGICFDYASLMSALLRSQQVPTKLVVGYSGTAYHAWISVYISEIGWVDNIIEFDGSNWSLMDPTLAANKANSSSAVKEYVGDGSNYTVKYNY
ncbi:MAG: transglutaminase domain-containing protein, partial [Lachnospiraceae bacterium]|nr:transglutaminase domain-containing protein [Lachnospiraceae bacterium]